MPLPNVKPEAIPVPRVEVSANLDDYPEPLRPAIAHHIDRKVKGVKVETLGGECKPVDGRFVCEAVLPNFPVVDKAGNPFAVHGVRIEVSNVGFVAQRIRPEAPPPAPEPPPVHAAPVAPVLAAPVASPVEVNASAPATPSEVGDGAPR